MPRSDAPREARLWEIVFPDHANHLGTLFGGQALSWMDKAAFVAATRYARRTVVTARSEQVDFHVPVRQGELVELVARVVDVGRSSMRVEVELTSEDPHADARRLCTRGHFTMIALDSSGKPATVNPPAGLDSPEPWQAGGCRLGDMRDPTEGGFEGCR